MLLRVVATLPSVFRLSETYFVHQTTTNVTKSTGHFTVCFQIKCGFQVIASNESKHRYIAACLSNIFQCY